MIRIRLRPASSIGGFSYYDEEGQAWDAVIEESVKTMTTEGDRLVQEIVWREVPIVEEV